VIILRKVVRERSLPTAPRAVFRTNALPLPNGTDEHIGDFAFAMHPWDGRRLNATAALAWRSAKPRRGRVE
jgi:hypothetical protein